MTVSVAIADAIRTLRSHPAVLDVRVEEPPSGGVLVKADFDTDLPSTWRANGESPTGVRSVEEVHFRFFDSFPKSSPRITLREDFNRNLPHINWHKDGERVPPCIAFGGNRSLLFHGGMALVAEQTSLWLRRAATGTLIDSALGWEPTRRESTPTGIEMDVEALANADHVLGRPMFYRVEGAWDKTSDAAWFGHAKQLGETPTTAMHKEMLGCSTYDGYLVGPRPLIVCWPDAADGAQPAVNDQYLPDTVHTFGDLLKRAEELCCAHSLRMALARVRGANKSLRPGRSMPVLFVLPVRRPANVTGFTTNIEMMAYRFDVPMTSSVKDWTNLKVSHAYFATPSTPTLQRRISGLEERDTPLSFAFIGCGSLGSKVAMHLVRAGVTPSLLADNDSFSPHNVARHVIFPKDAKSSNTKSEVLAQLISSFTGQTKPLVCDRDITLIREDNPSYQAALASESSVLVNTTANPAVRHFLADAPFQARVLEACAMNFGDVAVLTMDGPQHNPSTTDVMVVAYEELRALGLLNESASHVHTAVSVGLGCNSMTMPMSDARISMIAGGVGQYGLNLHQDGLPEHGVVSTARVSADGMSIAWQHRQVQATQIVNVDDETGWTVRVLDQAHTKIAADVARHPRVETGGVVVGRISQVSREITIVDVLDAPPDSRRLPTLFELGTEGLIERLTAYNESGSGVLWYLGTWHSHLAAMGPSAVDVETANSLKGTMPGAVVLLIHRPDGYSALVRSALS